MAPALQRFPNATQTIGKPSVDAGLREDVYLTLVDGPPTGPATIGVIVEPLASWLWLGGGIMAVGVLLALVPGRRRRPTDPTSVPTGDVEPEPAAEPDALVPA